MLRRMLPILEGHVIVLAMKTTSDRLIMSNFVRAAGIIAVLCLTFFAGFFVRTWTDSKPGEMEDYAVANILDELAYRHLLNDKQYDEMRRVADANLDGHLNRLRNHYGSIADTGFSATRTRTLAKVADLWDKEAPFQTPEFQQSKEKPWFAEWQSAHQENVALIKSAQAECKRVGCNTQQMR